MLIFFCLCSGFWGLKVNIEGGGMDRKENFGYVFSLFIWEDYFVFYLFLLFIGFVG